MKTAKVLMTLITCLSLSANAQDRGAEVKLVSEAASELDADTQFFTEEAVNNLLDYASGILKMDSHELVQSRKRMRIYKNLACYTADAVIIVSGVSEAVPGLSGAIKGLAGGVKIGNKTLSVKAIADDNATGIWGSAIAGGVLASIPGVIVETIATWDLKKIEKEIQKQFPGTQITAKKVKGESSKCGELAIRQKMLEIQIESLVKR
ncbi:MAG: hypothetical protein AB7O96_06005 [Pseudobdellovibrionaceae bacterium]